MKIIVDNKIPYIQSSLSLLDAETVYLDGSAISSDDVRDADVLIIRTRTRCNAQLLEGSRVKLILTATIGYDHLDTDYLHRAGIRWYNCPGCNASSVAQYIECTLLNMSHDFCLSLSEMTIGIVGCGHVGSRVADVARRYGMNVLICDPLLNHPDFVPLSTLERDADIITFHVPLTHEGLHATYHLADSSFFDHLQRCPFIINTSRGAVVDNTSLLQALDGGKVRQAIIDTWENEPRISLPLLNKVYIGTPHIAGYSADGKVNADNMVLSQLCAFYHLPSLPPIYPPSLPSPVADESNPLCFYNPLTDSEALKCSPTDFEYLRGHYPLRRESFSSTSSK